MLAALLSWLLPAAVYGNIYSSAQSGQYGSAAIESQLPVSFNTPSGVQLPTSFSFDPTGHSPPVFHSYNNQYGNQNSYGFYPNQIAAQAFASAAQFAQQFAATTPAPAAQPVVAQIDQQNLAKYSQYLDILQKAYGIQLPGELGAGQQSAVPPYQQSSYPSATSTSYQGGASPYVSTYQSGQYPQQVQQSSQQTLSPAPQPSYPSASYQTQYSGQPGYVPNSQEAYQSNYQTYQPQPAAQSGYSAPSVAPAQSYQSGGYSAPQSSYQVFPPLPPSNPSPVQPQPAFPQSPPQPQPQTYPSPQSPYQPQPAPPSTGYQTYSSQESAYYQSTAPAQPQPGAPAVQPQPQVVQQQTQYPYSSQVGQPASSYQTAYGQQAVQSGYSQGVQPPNTYTNQAANGVSNYQTAALGNVYSSYSGQGQGVQQPQQPQQPTAQSRPQVVPYVPGSLPAQPVQQPYVHPPLPSVKPTYSTHVGVDTNSVVEGSVVGGEGEDGFDIYYPPPATTVVTAPPPPPPTRPRPLPTTPRPTLPPTTRPATTPRPPPPTRPPTTKTIIKPEMAGTSIQALTQQVRKLPAVLYIDSRSPKAKETETLLRDTYGLPLVSFYVDKIERPRLVERNLQQLTAHKGLPYLFICGTFIGSDAHIDNYHRNGQFPQLVEYVCGDEKKKKKKTTAASKSN